MGQAGRYQQPALGAEPKKSGGSTNILNKSVNPMLQARELGLIRMGAQKQGTQNKLRDLESGGGETENSFLLECLLHFPTLPTQTGSATGHI